MVLREGKGWREESVEASSGGGRPILIGNFAWRVRLVGMEIVGAVCGAVCCVGVEHGPDGRPTAACGARPT